MWILQRTIRPGPRHATRPSGDRSSTRIATHDGDGSIDLDAPAPPWSHNPAAWSQRIPICLLAGLGFLLSSYMAAYQWQLIDSVYDPVFGAQSMKVLDSDVSHAMRRWFGIPDAALGALAFLGDAVFGLAGSPRRWQYRPWMVVLFGIDVIPLGMVSALLVFMQGAVVGSWCFPCIVTAVISLVLVAMAYDEVLSCLLFLRRAWRRCRSPSVVWRIFWGGHHRVSEEVALVEESSWKRNRPRGKA